VKDWQDIEVGKTYRIRNSLGIELDRTIVSVTEKKMIYQREEVEQGKLSDINPKRFITFYNQCGIPYDPQFSGDWVAAFIEPDIEFDEEDGQLTII
jgi:hypothetical protein